MNNTVLIIEDERELADVMAAYLKVEGFDTFTAYDGESGLELIKEHHPDVVLLDIMLPRLDGMEVCRQLREISDAIVIMVSAKNGEMDKVIALGTGADDYVTKPYSPLEVVARVRAQLRRYEKQNKQDGNHLLTCGELVFDKRAYTVHAGNIELVFTTKEFDMLYYFAENENLVLSREQIYDAVWGWQGIADDNSVTVYVNRIREKLNKAGLDYIKTVWGAGYKFCAG